MPARGLELHVTLSYTICVSCFAFVWFFSFGFSIHDAVNTNESSKGYLRCNHDKLDPQAARNLVVEKLGCEKMHICRIHAFDLRLSLHCLHDVEFLEPFLCTGQFDAGKTRFQVLEEIVNGM